MISVQDKDFLMFLVWRSRAQILGGDVKMYNLSTCAIRCAKCYDTTLWRGEGSSTQLGVQLIYMLKGRVRV
jgi:hypothetical protein